MTDEALEEVLGGIAAGEASGVIISNTTTDHSLLNHKTNQLPGG